MRPEEANKPWTPEEIEQADRLETDQVHERLNLNGSDSNDPFAFSDSLDLVPGVRLRAAGNLFLSPLGPESLHQATQQPREEKGPDWWVLF